MCARVQVNARMGECSNPTTEILYLRRCSSEHYLRWEIGPGVNNSKQITANKLTKVAQLIGNNNKNNNN